jgi:serine/threonine protein kinase/tetratricopeptide (TPR) repeat protein
MNEESLFHLALEKPASERAAFLEQVSAGDAALRQRLECLLEAYLNPGSFLEQPLAKLAGTSEAEFGDRPTKAWTEVSWVPRPPESPPAAPGIGPEAPGSQIGPYKLLQQIGEGGMGVVFMAEQTEPVHRKVALKIIRPGMDSRQISARFEAERQALALMDHPNIAKVLDAGTTNGSRRRETSEALGTLTSSATGRPYFVMELVKGVPITRYCDDQRLTPRERLELFIPVCQAVQHAHQKGVIHRDLKPSNVMIARYDGNPVPKVIDFGVAKAIGSKLTERTLFTEFGSVVGTLEYMSPEQAELNQLDVDTRSDIYSLGVLLYELLTGTTPLETKRLSDSSLLEVLRLIREEEPPRPSTRLSTTAQLPAIAANRGAEPKKLQGLVRGELDWIVMKCLEKDRSRRFETANSLARDLQRYLRDEPVEACPPSTGYRLRKFVRRYKRPVVAAVVVSATLVVGIAGTTWGLVRAEAARQGEAEQRQHAQASAEQALAAQQAAETREAEIQAVLDFVEKKVFAAARPEGQDGGLGHDVTLRRAVEAALPFVARGFTNQPLIEARLRRTLGSVFFDLGQWGTATEQFEEAHALFARQLGADHRDTLTCMNNLGTSYRQLGRLEDARQLHEQTLALLKAKLGPDHPDTLTARNSLAVTYAGLGRYADAAKLHEETLALRRTKFGPDHPETLYTMSNLAITYSEMDRISEALQLHEETLALKRVALGPDHPSTLLTMNHLANCYIWADREADALNLREETLALQTAKLGPDHPATLWTRHNLGASYRNLERNADALRLDQETLALRRAKLGPNHPETLLSLWSLAKDLFNLDRGAEAVATIDDCLRRAVGQRVHKNFPNVAGLRLHYFEEAEDAAGCRATAEIWEKQERTDAASLYQAACCRAVTAKVLRATDSSPATVHQADQEADRAIAWLKQAVAAGYKDVTKLDEDEDLEALRDRADFQKLLAELEGGD